ncbi:MAG TPA: hypothetical protein DCW90_20700 [Lachnospiraceae bacterium]|nr:hypothetical protein [Lachnospiraceae bacterium]
MDDLKLWETPNPMVDEIYHRDNYEVIDYDNTNICYVFFSSNGLFFPDTIKEFQEKIVDKNRYEWKRMASSKEIVVKSGRHIFVRDIYKQWYAKGISYLINSVDKMVLLLKQLTEGYDVITVGSSAGGYMAALMAAELSAKACFDFAGQISFCSFSNKSICSRRSRIAECKQIL